MADVSKIRVDGVEYDVKDAAARDKLLNTAPKKLSSRTIDVFTTEQLTAALTTMLTDATSEGVSIAHINISGTSTQLFGGEWCVIVSNTWNAYGFAIAIKYANGQEPDIFMCSCWNSVWSDWHKTFYLPQVTTSDNGKVLKVVDGVWTAVSE